MLEGLIEKLILKYFGDYIENLDRNKLSVGIWSGNLTLEDIVIKSKPINNLKLPFRLIYGRIGKLDIQIPWKSNFSAPTVINIEEVQVALSLIHQEDWGFLDFISYEAKIGYLNKFAQERIQELQDAFTQKEEKSSYSDRVLLKILDNLHVNFKNIHIRVEENLKAPFYSIGITLQEMLVVNTNENWVEQFIDRNVNKNINVYKLLKISNFGIYLNSCETNFLSQADLTKDIIKNRMKEILPFEAQKAVGIEYLIKPISLTAKLRQNNESVNLSSMQDRVIIDTESNNSNSAKANLWINLDNFDIDIEKSQFDCIFRTLNHISKYQRFQLNYYQTRKFRPFRPKCKIFDINTATSTEYNSKDIKNQNAVKWWKYAIDMTIKKLKYSRGNLKVFDLPHEFLENSKSVILELYTKFYKNPNSLSTEELAKFRDIIEVVELQELFIWIKPVLQQLFKESKKEENKKAKSGFFTKMFGNKLAEEEFLSQEDEEKIEEILENSVKEATNQILISDIETKIQVYFALNNGSFSFSKSYSKGTANSTEGFSFKYKDLLFSLRKGEYFTEIDSELKDFNIEMFTVINKNTICIPITFKNFHEEIKRNSFICLDKMDISRNSLIMENSLIENIDENFVWRFSLKKTFSISEKSSKLFFQINSLNIIYHQVLLERILSFLKVDVNEDLANTAWDKINEIKETTQESLKDVLENKNIIEMKIMPRKIIIPINKYDLKNSRMLIVEIGKMNFYNAAGDEKYNRMYNLDITKVTLAHYNSFNDMRFNKRRFELITDVSASLGFALLNPKYSSKDLPDFKLIINIQNITINLTEHLYTTLFYIIDIFKPAQEADLWSQLNQDKTEIKKNSKIFGKIMKKNQIYRNWEEYFAVLSSGYIYFYKSVDEDEYSGYYYIKDAELIIDQAEDPLHVILKNKFGMIEVKFPSETKLKQWTTSLRERIHEMKTTFEAMTEEINKNIKIIQSNEIYFGLELNLKQAVAYLYSDNIKNMKESKLANEKMFTIGFTNFNLELNLRYLETEIKMYLQGIKVFDDLYNLREFRQILDSTDPEDKDLKLVNIEIYVFDETSPNYKNTQIEINIKIGYLYAIWNPIVIRRLLSFLAHNDILRNKIIREIQLPIERQIDDKFISPVDEEFAQRLVCSEFKYTYIKLNTILKKVRVIWVQPVLNFMFMELRLGYSVLNLDMKVDHFTLNGELGNTQLLDLSNYPFTIKNQFEFSPMNVKEILGAKENSTSLICFEYKSMNTWCPHCDENYTTEAYVKINSITLLYIQEHFMRFFNYLFSEFLGALGPGEDVKQFRNEKNQIKVTSDISQLERMKLNVTINNPEAILKPRAHFKEYFLINAATVIITCSYDKVYNIIRNQPDLWRWTTTYHFEIKNFFITTHDNFSLCDPTDGIVNMHFSILTEEDKFLTDFECDKSFQIDLFFHSINVNLRQIDFTNIMRLNDLNILYTDEQEESYNYENYYNKNEEIKKDDNKKENQDEKLIITTIDQKSNDFNYMFFFLFIPNISLKLFLMDGPFSELSVDDIQLTFNGKLNNTKEIDISISLLEIFHFIDNINKEIILSDFTQPIQEFNNSTQEDNNNLKININPTKPKFTRRNTAIVKNEKSKNVSSISQIILKDFLSDKKQISRISDKVHNLKIVIDEEREKSYIIKLKGMKLIIGNTSIILLKQFFVEGFPFYDKDDKDLPNLYDSNEDNYPGMKVYLEIQNPLICFLSDEISRREQDLICLSCEIVFGYKKEKIAKLKNDLLFNYNELNQIKSYVEDEAQKEHLENAIINDKSNAYSLTVSLFDICPFITNMNDVLFSELLVIPKRKLIENFMFTYASQTQMRYIPSNTYLINNMAKLDLNKMTIKASYKDLVLVLRSIDHINKQMDENYVKNYDTLSSFTRTKTLFETTEQLKNKENKGNINDSILPHKFEIKHDNINRNDKVDNKLRYSLPNTRFNNSDEMRKSLFLSCFGDESIMEQSNAMETEEDLQDTDEMICSLNNNVVERRKLTINQSSFQKYKPKDEVIDKGMSSTNIMSQGIQLILIDDHANTFYPFLSLVINQLQLSNEYLNFNQNIINASSVVKVLVYNYIAGIWEPLVEKCNINLEITNDKADEKVHSTTININIPVPPEKPYNAFNINLSDISVSFLYMTFNSWIDKYLKLINNYSVEIKKLIHNQNEKSMTISNHTIFNYTGRKMHLYKLDKQNNVRINKLCEINLNQNYDVEYFDETKEYYDPSAEVTQSLLKENYIYFELEGVKTNENILKIDNIQTKTHKIDYSQLRSKIELGRKEDSSNYEFIVSQVKFQDLRKFVYFYPPLSFKNKTQHTLFISLIRKGLPDIFLFVESKNTVGIPYEYMDGEIEFQCNNSNPNLFPIINFLTKNVIKSNLIFKNLCLNLSFIANENTKNRVITINHSYCIRNCLPFDISVVIIKTKQVFLIPKGEKLYVDVLSISDNIVISIFFLNFRTEKEVTLYNYKEPTKTFKSFNLLDDKNNSLSLLATIVPGDTVTAVIYSNGVIINNTLMNIKFYYGKNKKKSEVAGQKEIANVFLLSEEKHIFLECNGCISEPQNVTIMGISTVVECKKNNNVIEFIMECNLSLVAQDLDIYTNIITFSPRFILCNEMNLPILVSLYKNGSESDLIRSHDKKAFYFFNKGCDNLITLRLMESYNNIQVSSKWNWSEPISILSDGLLTIQINGFFPHEKRYINLEKKIESFSTLVVMKETDYYNCQFYIENYSNNVSCKIWQQDYESNADYINVRSKSIFAWTNYRNKKIINVKFFIGSIFTKPLSVENEITRKYEIYDEHVTFLTLSDIDKEKNSDGIIKVYPASEIIQIKTSMYTGYSIKLQICSDGMRKFFKITDITHDISKITTCLTQLVEFNVKIDKLGVSLMADNRHIKENKHKYKRNEIVYISLRDIMFYSKKQIVDQSMKTDLQLKIKDIEIDNEYSYLSHFPIIMRPVNCVKFMKEEEISNNLPPFFNCAVFLVKNKNDDITKILLLNYLIQSFYFTIDSNVIVAMLNFFQNLTIDLKTSVTYINPLFIDNKTNLENGIFIKDNYFDPIWLHKTQIKENRKLFIQKLEMSPMEILISFIAQSKDKVFTKLLQSNRAVSSLLSTITNIENAPVLLNGSQMFNIYGNFNQIIQTIYLNYKQSLLMQVMKMFGSIDILGNPNNLLRNLGTGFKDFFEKPAKGIVKGPLEGAKGVFNGSLSLVKHTVEGTFTTTSKITSGISKGILYITQDDDYINEREKKKITEKPKNFVEGIGYGLSSMAGGIFYGVSDIVVKPIQGAKKDKWAGFGKGMLKGLAGVVVKPISGVLELVSKTTEGIKNTVNDDDKIKMERFPRPFYGKFQYIKAYNIYHARVIEILSNKIEHFKNHSIDFYSSEIYKNKKGDNILIVFSTTSIYIIDVTRKELKTILNYKDIKEIYLENTDKIRIIFRRQINGKLKTKITLGKSNITPEHILNRIRDAMDNNYEEN